MTTPSLFRALSRSLRFRMYRALGITPRPTKLRIKVTNRCNARCRMCNAWRNNEDKPGLLSVEDIGRLFTESRGCFANLRHVSLTGGEPLMREDLEQIVRMIHECAPKVSINVNTNGFRRDRLEPMAEALAADGIVVTWNVSLDALGETHDAMRGVPRASNMARGSIDALLALKEKGLPVRIGVNHVITAANWNEFRDVYEFCRERRIAFHPITPMTGALYDNEGAAFDLPDEARRGLEAVFLRILRENPSERLAYYDVLTQLRGRRRDYACWAGYVLVLVEEDGSVLPNGGCPAEWRLGHLRDFGFDLGALLKGERARRVLSRVRRCRRCQLACETLTSLKHPEALAARRKIAEAEREVSRRQSENEVC